MHELAMILRRRRLEGGAIELTLPEIKIDLDKKGRVSGAHVAQNTVSHQIIEEFMLAANEAVAEHLNGQRLNFLRRVHEPPDPRKLHALTEFVRELGIECESLQSRFEIKRVVELVKGQPREHAVHYAVLRSMQKAVYGPQEEGHYALHSKHYCHFTSPIRRYPDLVVHRMLDSLARGTRPPDDFDYLAVLGQHCSEREQRAEAAERELDQGQAADVLEQPHRRVDGSRDHGRRGVRPVCSGIELPAEGMIRIDALSDDFYRYDRPDAFSDRLSARQQLSASATSCKSRSLTGHRPPRTRFPLGAAAGPPFRPREIDGPATTGEERRAKKKTALKRQATKRTAKRRGR